MNINELCSFIDKISNESEIFVSNMIKSKIDSLKKFNSIIDARSLTFFSLGRQNINNDKKCTTCIISSKEVSNVLSALTEAKYQQEKLIIISVGDNIQIDAFEDVTDKIIISDNLKIIENNFHEYINELYFKPLLINFAFELENKNANINSNIIEILTDKINSEDKLFTNIEGIDIKNNSNIILWNNEYGVISRYLGNLSANNERKLYLLTSYESFCNDINAFYTRYISKNFVIFYLRKEEKTLKININNWADQNDINFIDIKSEKDLEELQIKNLKDKSIIEILV